MRDDQTNAVLRLLQEIRDRLPVQTIPTVTGLPYPDTAPRDTDRPPYFVDVTFEPASVPDVPAGAATVDLRGAWMREAFRAVLDALDGWIEGAYENHEALEHGGEPVGDECWRRFHPSDIRRMVADAARELGVTAPEATGVPKEDVVGL